MIKKKLFNDLIMINLMLLLFSFSLQFKKNNFYYLFLTSLSVAALDDFILIVIWFSFLDSILNFAELTNFFNFSKNSSCNLGIFLDLNIKFDKKAFLIKMNK